MGRFVYKKSSCENRIIKSFSVSRGAVCWQFFVAVGIQSLGLYIMSNVDSKKKGKDEFKLVNSNKKMRKLM